MWNRRSKSSKITRSTSCVHFEKLCREELSDLYSYAEDRRAARELEKCLALHRAWLAMDTRFDRPHRDTTEYPMRIYGKMVFLLDLIPREQLSEYYDKCMRLARERNDREEIYRTSARYYQCTGDNERAAAYVDSVLTYYAQTGKKADLGSIYMAQSHMYEAAGNYEKALKAVREGNEYRYHNLHGRSCSGTWPRCRPCSTSTASSSKRPGWRCATNATCSSPAGIVLLLLAGWGVYLGIMVRRLKRAKRAVARRPRGGAAPELPRPGEREDEDGVHQLDVPRDTHAPERHQRFFGTDADRGRPRNPASVSGRDTEKHRVPDIAARKHAGTLETHQHRGTPSAGRDRRLPDLRRTAGTAKGAERKSIRRI